MQAGKSKKLKKSDFSEKKFVFRENGSKLIEKYAIY